VVKKIFGACVLAFFCVSASQAADVLAYGPSLTPSNDKGVVNEATVAEDEGHDVTVVDEGTWSSMSTQQFASYDAIVIGDAGCDFSDGEDLDAVNANKATWSPVVTGNIVMNTFDAFLHIFGGATEAEATGLAAAGINYAASGPGTGLYYSNGCRNFGAGDDDKGDPDEFSLEFMSLFGFFGLVDNSPDNIIFIEPGHPALDGLTEEDLSCWGSSTHGQWVDFPNDFEVVAEGDDEIECPDDKAIQASKGDDDTPTLPVIIARDGRRVGPIPTLSPIGLGLLGLVLAGLGGFVARRRRR
jgi:hypothetical protein